MANLKKSPLAVGLSVTVILAGVLGIHGVAHADSLANDTTTNDPDTLANTTLATTDAPNSNLDSTVSNQVVIPDPSPTSEPVAVSSPTSNQPAAPEPCSTVPVPEPSSTLGTLAFGALGTGYMLKRKFKKQKSVRHFAQ